MTDGIILLHGILRTNKSMRGLANFLHSAGFEVLNIDYPSTKHSIEDIADKIHKNIELFQSQLDGKLHFVGYSMGGLIARAYLARYKPQNLGCVVMLGTPNKGSELADFWRHSWIYQKLYGPAGQQLITDQQSFKDIFSNPYYDFGIIAGNKTVAPISSLIIGKPSDGRVSIENTRLEGAKDHIVLACSHIFLPLSKDVWNQTLYFIRNRKFQRNLVAKT
jgi:pimeloyl-ACP methyl ester carboxylesterase